MIKFIESIYYNTKWYHYLLIIPLLPLSLIYGAIGLLKYLKKKKDYNIKIISIGNLIIGGSGKTPFAKFLIDHFKNYKITYISRGYARASKGLIEVKKDGKILTDVYRSGDEAMLIAEQTNADVIVSENRDIAIELAKKNGSNLIILDDAFSKKEIKKFDILLEPPKVTNYFPLPAGPFREFFFLKKAANLVLKENRDFKRVVTIPDSKTPVLLVTSIANPDRLNKFLPPNVVGKYILKDHSYFNKDEILKQMQKFNAKKILVTQKDYVKLKDFKLPTIILKLKLEVDFKALKKIEEYVFESKNWDCKNPAWCFALHKKV